MAESPVLYEARDGVAVITLNRPDVLNAFTPEMLAATREALERAATDGQRCLLLTGAGRGFSAGMDLASIQHQYSDGGGPDFVSLLTTHFHPVVERLVKMPMPTVAAVNGVAAGAGMSLTLACDTRIAADGARFATAFTRIGLVPDCGMAYTLPRLVGAGRAMQLMVGAEPVDAVTALGMGLVDRVVPAADLHEQAFTFAKQLANGPTHAFVLTRRLVSEGMTLSFDQLLDLEARLQAEAGATSDHRGAVDAFLRKQPATFSGT